MSLTRIRRRKYYNSTIIGTINDILDRFAKRYGRISNSDAEELQIKLANKYSENVTATLLKVRNENECGFAYPRDESMAANTKIMYDRFNEQERLKRVKEGFNNPVGDFCLIPKYSREHHRCECCGKMARYEVSSCDNIVTEVNFKLYLNGWSVCKDKRCRAIAVFFKRGNRKNPLIHIINEVTKHGGNNENKRRLEKHFIRHA